MIMDRHFHIPMDYAGTHAFQVLAEKPGLGPVSAHLLYLLVTRALAYAAEIAPPGRLPREALERVARLPEIAAAHIPWPLALEALTAPGGLLAPAGEDWHCAAFARSNRHLSTNAVRLNDYGGFAHRTKALKKRAEAAAGEMVLENEDVYLKPDGLPMSAEDRRRVRAVIILFDNVLGLRARGPEEFTAGLVQAAWRVLNGHAEAVINRLAQDLVCQVEKAGPDLPPDTLSLLQGWDEYARRLRTEIIQV